MEKTQDAFRTIGEVAEELDLPQHVLRFWETKFTQIRPIKRAGGRRYYRPDDVQLVAAIRILLYSEGYTIKGVQRILREQGARAVVTASRAGVRGAQTGLVDAAPMAAESRPDNLAALLAPLDPPSAAPPPAQTSSPALSQASHLGEQGQGAAVGLSAQHRHRMEAILAELSECARLLEEARRR
jgi:DNA-binding transcriptional MerR regulator